MPNKYKLTTHREYMRNLPPERRRRVEEGTAKLIAEHDRELARKKFWRSLLTSPLKLLGRVAGWLRGQQRHPADI